jgi:hypothetical protein
MPLYLYQARGLDLKAIALTAWLPFVAGDLGLHGGRSPVRLAQAPLRYSHRQPSVAMASEVAAVHGRRHGPDLHHGFQI